MFTRYKGIEIPQNYSGNRFKSEVPPPITETKTHKPTSYSPTKTSISPLFENALKTADAVSDFKKESYETDEEFNIISNDDLNAYAENNEENLDAIEEIEKVNSIDCANESFDKEKRAITHQKGNLLDEFKPLIGKIIGNVNSEDLLLLSLVVLLMGESNASSNELILPLLFLLLYH